jgi:hypothetical protein
MRPLQLLANSLVITLLVGACATLAHGDEPCPGYKWDVSKEHALFGAQPKVLLAGKDSASAPGVEPDRLYELELAPETQVAFSAPPGRQTRAEDAFAGLVALKIAAAGSYRISVDLPLWIDVAVNGRLVRPKDYEGQQSCSAPRKIVEFDLDKNQPLVLQFSGANRAEVRLAITRAPGG